MRATLVLLLLLAAATLATSARAGGPSHHGCDLTPHGVIVAGNTNGCTFTDSVTQFLWANVTVTAGTVDAIEISANGPGEQHVFLCTFEVVASSCLLPVQDSWAPGTWSVTARIVAADPVGVLVGNVDTYSRFDATFV
ncbi:MAG TPA: hypothetical protein VM370_01275 [Candidatus Thermoplasmatota archaeon]|nr:hypothetical protein [Candidatus Thermoplasmatota archaeon]